MPLAIKKKTLNEQVCDALGIDISNVAEITIRFTAVAAEVTVKHIIVDDGEDDSSGKLIAEVLKNYLLVPKD